MKETDTKRMSKCERWQKIEKAMLSKQGFNTQEFDELYDTGLELLRKDKEQIRKLLKEQNLDVLIEKEINKKSYLFLKEPVHLIQLYQNTKEKPEYFRKIIDLIKHSEYFLDSYSLKQLNCMPEKDKYNQQGTVISFGTILNQEVIYKVYKIYHYIRKNSVIQFSYSNYQGETFFTFFHPELIKQYKSKWYLFGMMQESKERQPHFGRITINRIEKDSIKLYSEIPFKSSGTNYQEYFEPIIGIENFPKAKPHYIKFLVRQNIAKRIDEEPLHLSQERMPKEDREISGTPFLCYRLKVKQNKELVRTCLQFGKDLIVISPTELAEEIQKELKKAIENYQQID